MKNNLLFAIVFLTVVQSGLGQCNLKEYVRIFQEANSLQAKGEFIEAKNRYEAAKIYACNQKDLNAADEHIDALFEQINQLRQRAQIDRERADLAKSQSDSLFKMADKERNRAEAALDKIYFYQGRFGLAYDKNAHKYGFLDKETNVRVRFKYDEAKSFDPQGLAQVGKDLVSKDVEGKNLVQYLIDTLGNEFPLELRKGRLGKETKAVDFSYSNLLFIPIKVTNQVQLRVLRINYAKINKIPRRVRKLSYLQYFQLRNNRIKKIDKGIGDLKNLQSFELSGNKLTKLPEELGGLINLKILNLSDNHITIVPDQIVDLKNLQSLDLEKNKLTNLPEGFSKLENLQELNLRENRISELPADVLGMKQLKKIDLGKNPCLVAYIEQVRKSMPWCEVKF